MFTSSTARYTNGSDGQPRLADGQPLYVRPFGHWVAVHSAHVRKPKEASSDSPGPARAVTFVSARNGPFSQHRYSKALLAQKITMFLAVHWRTFATAAGP